MCMSFAFFFQSHSFNFFAIRQYNFYDVCYILFQVSYIENRQKVVLITIQQIGTQVPG